MKKEEREKINEIQQMILDNMFKKKENNSQPKYEYHLLTWGGFYNDKNVKIHKKVPGDFWFDSFEERQKYIDELKKLEQDLGIGYLMISLTEGYCCRIKTELHRVIEYKGKRYYSKYDIGFNYPFDAARYHLEYKWTCGFNDYPLGEDFDYDNSDIEIIQEWITGADQVPDLEDR